MAPLVALTGFMGSGKSSIGPRVAELLGWRFIDLDEAFVDAEKVSIADFFSSQGESAFRDKECELLEKALAAADRDEVGLVIALGGGTLETPKARELLCQRGGVIFLDVEAGRAWSRVEGTGRPLAADPEKFFALLERRRQVYEGAAAWVLPVEERGVDDMAAEIAGLARAAGEAWPGLWGRRLSSTQRSSLVVGGVDALRTLGAHAESAHRRGARLFVVTDRNVAEAWIGPITSLLGASSSDAVLVLEPGEASKSVRALEQCWNWLAEQRARRDDVVVALGGGVVGDLAGFAAATYQRGVALWQVPTTLLSQVDSSIGGKTAVDLPAGKNMVGAFYQADLVVADPVTLTTLPNEDYIAGFGEVVKHALLMPPAHLDALEREAAAVTSRDLAVLSRVVKTSVAFKAAVVQEDEREQGKRAILNLGHTVAHALEVVFGYGCISHGNAVSLGLLVALDLSERVLGLDRSIRPRVQGLLSAFGLRTVVELPSVGLLLDAMGRDKKARAGSTGFVGLQALGEPVWGLDVPGNVMERAIEVIRQ